MTLTYGFYDALSNDRVYTAAQMSRLFEGIITDGIFQTIGTAFVVTHNTGSMNINVGAGRAWFNYTWTLNDSVMVLTVDASEAVLHRIDAVVLEVDTDVAVRANSIKIIKGTPGSSPVAPTMANTATKHQYRLANIAVNAGVTQITAGNITNFVGTVSTPFITGILQSLDVATLLAQYQYNFDTWFATLVDELTTEQAGNLQSQITVNDGKITRSLNYKIVPSITSNNLVFSLKYMDGGDATALKPIVFRVGDTKYSVTAGLTFTKNAGTNWMNMGSAEFATCDVDLFTYAIAETGASAGLKFGYSRIPYATTMGDFVNTTTSEKYIAGNWTNFNATDLVENIGRFRARLSAGAGYTWSIPVPLVRNYPIFETDMLKWLPVLSGNSGMTITSPVAVVADYNIVGRKLSFSARLTGTLVTPAGNQVLFTLPFSVLRTDGMALASQLYSENGTVGFGGAFWVTGTPHKAALIKYDFAAHTLGAGIWEPLGFYYI